jgi:hypothetical protein
VTDTDLRSTRTRTSYPPVGSYAVVRTRGLVPWLIRVATHSPYDHAFVLVDDRGGIIEAEPGGVQRNHIGQYLGCKMAVNSAEAMTDAQRNTVAHEAEQLVGVAYNDLDIASLGLEALGWHWRWLAKVAAGDHKLICSALVALVGGKADLDWNCGKTTAAEVTPADLAKRPGMQPWPAS